MNKDFAFGFLFAALLFGAIMLGIHDGLKDALSP